MVNSITEGTMIHHLVIVLLLLWLLNSFDYCHPFAYFASLVYIYLVHESYVIRLRRRLQFEEKRQSYQRRVLTDSESVRWLNHALEKIWPVCMEHIVSQKILLPIIPWFMQKYKPWTVKDIDVQHLYLGRCPPMFTEMRVLHQSTGDDHLALELGMNFCTEDMNASLAVKLRRRLGLGMRAKLHLLGMHVEGKVLVGVKFLPKWPFLDRLRVCFAEPPYFQMTVKPIFSHGLDVTELPGIAGWLDKLLAIAFEQTLVEPNMLVVDVKKFASPEPENWFTVDAKETIAHVVVQVFEAAGLKPSDLNGLADPYLKGRLGPYRFRTKTQKKTLTPKWQEEFKIPVCSWESPNDELKIEVCDKDHLVDDSLGGCSIKVTDFRDGQRHDMWLALKNIKMGRLHLAITVIEGDKKDVEPMYDEGSVDDEQNKDSFENDAADVGPPSELPDKAPKVADRYEPIDIEGQEETGVWVHHPGVEIAQVWEPRKGKGRKIDGEDSDSVGSFKSTDGSFKLKKSLISPLTTSSHFPPSSLKLSIRVKRIPVNKHTRHIYCKRMTSTSPAVNKITAPYGSWKSPITADVVSGSTKRLGGFAADSLSHLIWLESRPTESGRGVIVKEPEKPGDSPADITPKDYAVRTVAQEYGGGDFSIYGDTLIFSNYKDQRLYKQSISSRDSAPTPITPDYGGPQVCYADGVFDSRFNRFVAVREDSRESITNSITTIVSIDLSNDTIQEPKELVGGNDFYAFPRMDPRGERMAWIEWGHPNMPWDRSELWVGYISDNGDVIKRICVAGGDKNILESPTEPKWSPQGELYFVTDRTNGFWNIYKWVESTNEVLPMYTIDGEFTRPLWVFGFQSYDFLQNRDRETLIACSYRKNGESHLGILDVIHGKLTLLGIPFTDINNITAGINCLYVEGASTVHPSSIAKVTLDDQMTKVVEFKIMWSSSSMSLVYESYISVPELVEFPTDVPGQNAYAYFYPPTNTEYQAGQDEKPPLLLKSHGGPTAEARGSLNLSIQYWTSRGWALVDVNYGGSTGYGREFRERLLRNWGIVDVNDCCSCAKFLVDSGRVDGERLCITGSSAGGYTTLAALAFKDVFKAGCSLYGIGDLKLLVDGMPKFESHYIDNLVGDKNAYFERSPINFVDKFSCPIILFQGLDDKVVPPEQARKIYQALKAKGLPVALVEYEGEQHGFRKAENIKFTLEQQMVFFARLVGHFQVADPITPVKIDNFD